MKTILETNRLLLRHLTIDDVDDLLGIFSDPEAMRYYPATKGRKETIDWIDWNLNSYREYGFGLWAVIRKDTSNFAGQCGLILQRNVDGRDEVEKGRADECLERHFERRKRDRPPRVNPMALAGQRQAANDEQRAS
jgi:RimJ/RimL family protein N-acetyltransferase